MLQRTDIRQELIKTRGKGISKAQVLAEVYEILNAEGEEDQQVFSGIKNPGDGSVNNFDIDLLESDHIFHISQIKKICIDYRLRFLDTGLFKGKIPSEALFKIEKLEEEHQTSLEGFKIIAPSKLFKLENADDPLLFAPLGNDYFYLIHKWGNDLHPLRKLLMKPFKCLENFVVFILLLSFLIALCIPLEKFTEEPDSLHFALIFAFTFKSIVGIAIFYGVALGKNFSEFIWNSKYFNS